MNERITAEALSEFAQFEMPPLAISPFAMLVNPDSIQQAAERIGRMGLPRLVVRAFTDKETPGRKPRKKAAAPVEA